MTVIEIRPYRNGWEVFESRGVQPVFLNQVDAIDYATGRARFRVQAMRSHASYRSVRQIEDYDVLAKATRDILAGN